MGDVPLRAQRPTTESLSVPGNHDEHKAPCPPLEPDSDVGVKGTLRPRFGEAGVRWHYTICDQHPLRYMVTNVDNGS